MHPFTQLRMTIDTPQLRKKVLTVGMIVILLIVGRLLLSFVTWQGSPAIQAAIESFSAGLAFFSGLLALIRFYTKENRVYLFVGVGLLLTAVLDALYALFNTVWIEAIAASPSLLWQIGLNLSPLVFAVLVTMSWLVWWREMRQSVQSLFWGGITAVLLTLVLLGVTAVGRLSSLSVYVRLEILLATPLFIFSLHGVLRKRRWLENQFEFWLVVSLICHLAAQTLFLPFAAAPYDLMHTVAALLKPIGYLGLLVGLLQSMVAFFRKGEETAVELTTANLALQREIADRKRVEAAELEQRQLAEALREIGLALSATLDFNELLDCLLDQIAQVLPYDTANVMQVNGELIEIVCTRGYNRRIVQPFTDPFPIARMPSLQQMVREQNPLVIEDTAVYPEWVNPEDSPHVRSWAGAPIYVQGEIVAFLALNNSQPGFYHATDAIRLSAFAGQAAIAIQNARLYEELQKRVDEQVTLNKISQAVTSTLELQKTLTIITDETTRLLAVDATSVVLLDQEKGDLRFAAASGEASDFVLGKRLALGQGILGWVSQHGEPLLVSDVETDERHFPQFDAQSGFKARSILCVPLKSKGQTIGAIEAINKLTGPFNEDDLRLLILLSGPLATAIENAQL
ncbi:MAG: GAF domain-containing protein, partial [Anaerolineales bacterium]|nr:GAF domain-containing protein [Anaerolineales bacterium]